MGETGCRGGYDLQKETVLTVGTLSVYIGIDPGKMGAVAVIDAEGKRLSSCPMPIKDGEIDVVALRGILQFATDHVVEGLVVLEKAQALPRQGVVSVFSYGVGYGRIKAVLDLLALPYIEVHPGVWKKALHLDFKFEKINGEEKKELGKRKYKHKRSGKLAACALAEKLFGFECNKTHGGLKDGEAEALLLAEWGRRNRGE